MLFVGTGNALYYSMDDGASYKPIERGLPHAPVSWIVVQKQAHDLVVSTYGRGFFIMQDISPLEQGAMEPTRYRGLRDGRPTAGLPHDPRRRGAHRLHGQASAQWAGRSGVHDEKGDLVRKMPPINAHVGLNRFNWDMHYEPPRLVALRTTPPENPHIWEEPRFQNQDTRPITHWGLAQAEDGPIAGPGKYTVKVTANGQTYTQPFEVRRNPDSHGTESEAAILRPPAAQSARRHQRCLRHDQPDRVDAQAARRSAEDRGRPR